MNKPIVQYREIFTDIQVGKPVLLVPVNHPDRIRVSNTGTVLTSNVVKIHHLHGAGKFETENTLYEPLETK